MSSFRNLKKKKSCYTTAEMSGKYKIVKIFSCVAARHDKVVRASTTSAWNAPVQVPRRKYGTCLGSVNGRSVVGESATAPEGDPPVSQVAAVR